MPAAGKFDAKSGNFDFFGKFDFSPVIRIKRVHKSPHFIIYIFLETTPPPIRGRGKVMGFNAVF